MPRTTCSDCGNPLDGKDHTYCRACKTRRNVASRRVVRERAKLPPPQSKPCKGCGVALPLSTTGNYCPTCRRAKRAEIMRNYRAKHCKSAEQPKRKPRPTSGATLALLRAELVWAAVQVAPAKRGDVTQAPGVVALVERVREAKGAAGA